jgi:hypothetical protein
MTVDPVDDAFDCGRLGEGGEGSGVGGWEGGREGEREREREREDREENLNAYSVTISTKLRETASRIALLGRNEFAFASIFLPLQAF